jgi:hypothetical protein
LLLIIHHPGCRVIIKIGVRHKNAYEQKNDKK